MFREYLFEDEDDNLSEHGYVDGQKILYARDVVEEMGYLQAKMEMCTEIQEAKRHRRQMRYLENLRKKTER